MNAFKTLTLAISLTALPLAAADLVILQTNDTHSQIDPSDKGLGGIQRRKALIDSIRGAEKNVLLVDAGDAVQGTLFFTLYKGEAEMKMMEALGYDLAILGNHDFDNGMDDLKRNVSSTPGIQWLSTNYEFDDPQLDSIFAPYKIYDIDGRRIAFIGINLDPKGMIADGNYDGVRYLDGIKAANATAWSLKHNEKADAVIAVTHVGYDEVPPSDRMIASQSEDIDVILGGHSHTVITPGSGMEWVSNLDGKPVLITQNGKSGVYLTQVTLDLDSLGTALPRYKQYSIDSRLDGKTDTAIEESLKPYRGGIDEMMNRRIGRTAYELNAEEPGLLNFVSDFLLMRGEQLLGRKPSLSIANKGSLRRGLPKGNITEGEVITMQPFANRIVVIELPGSQLAKAFDVMAARGGDGVSANVEAVYDPATRHCTSILIDGKPINPDATYTVATIDYLANGGDYMEPLTHGKRLATSEGIVYTDLVSYIESLKNKTINPSKVARMHP